jgi:hypothetical protein
MEERHFDEFFFAFFLNSILACLYENMCKFSGFYPFSTIISAKKKKKF